MNKNDIHAFAQDWIDKNSHKWSNNTNEVGDNYGSFVAGYNKANETLYTEEQMMEYAEWIFNLDTHTILTMPKEALLQEFISQSLKK